MFECQFKEIQYFSRVRAKKKQAHVRLLLFSSTRKVLGYLLSNMWSCDFLGTPDQIYILINFHATTKKHAGVWGSVTMALV